MSGAYSGTGTNTYTTSDRLGYIKRQFRTQLRLATAITDEDLERLMQGFTNENRWIARITVYAFDTKNLCHAELFLHMNWETHDKRIAIDATVKIDNKKQKDGTAIELDESIKFFNSFVDQHSFRTDWYVTYTKKVYDQPPLLAHVRQTLGLGPVDPVKWAGKKEGDEVDLSKIDEVRHGSYYYFDE